MIYGRQPSDTRKLEGGQLDVGNREFGGHEAVIILDDVFVPWEQVFMAGEYVFSRLLVERFAGYHRQSYGGCKVGVGDVLATFAGLRPLIGTGREEPSKVSRAHAVWEEKGLLTITGGKLTTFEKSAQVAAVAQENFERAGVDELVTVVVGDAHEEVTKLKGPIDMVFIDADKAGYVDYLNKLLPLVRPGGLILAHNVPGTAPDYVEAVTTNPDLDTVFYRQGNGMAMTLKKR